MQLLTQSRLEEALETSVGWIDELLVKIGATVRFAGRFQALSRCGMHSERSVRAAYEAAFSESNRL